MNPNNNPNQPPNYQRYPPQQQFTNNYNNTTNINNYPNMANQHNLNIPNNNHPYSFQTNQGTLQFNNANKPDRAMYSSTIEPSIYSANKNVGFGKLQSMGRFIGQEKHEINKPRFQPSSYIANNNNSNNFSQNREQRPKLQTFTNHTKGQTQFDRFPSFNINDKANQNSSINNQLYQGIQSQNNSQSFTNQTQIFDNQTAEQKRKRQILAIKKELELINKKMQSTNLNKKYLPQNATLDKNANIQKNTSTNTSTTGNNQYSYGNNANNNSTYTGQNNSNSDFLQVGNRNKGMVSQSMIVSNEPSPGYKYQSIFDKYDSMKKPTYQTQQTKKEQGGLLLDKFVGKGPGLKSINTPSQEPTKIFNKTQEKLLVNNSYQTSTGQSNSLQNNDLNYTKPTQKYTSYNLNTTQTKPATYTTYDETTNKEGGMFKKKKQNPYTLQAHNAETKKALITSPKNSMSTIPIFPTNIATSNTKNFYTENETNFKQQTPSLFKKTFQQNIVQKKMKEKGIEESVLFKRSDFVVGKKLGKGQFGEVMLVQHKKTGFLCGMKVMEKKQIRQEKYEGQIARELSIQFYLAHRNIAPLYGYFQDQANVYLLVEYCTGGQLLEMLRKDRRMEQKDVSLVIRQICEGIDYIHKQEIIHRDIKPQNILFNFGVAKICDFGWAVYSGNGMRKTASGSPLYYSPQIVLGAQYDQKIDIWDIGMMTYECLLGKIPFRIYSQLDLNRIVQDEIKFPQYIDTTPEAQDFILKIMKKKPQERMEIKQIMRHPFITKYQQKKLPIQVMEDIKKVLVA